MEHLAFMLLAAMVVSSFQARAPALQRTVALTFDDLPDGIAHDITTMKRNTMRLLRALKLHRAPAIGFVNEINLHIPGESVERINLLRQWVDSGMILGNHTFSHLKLFDTSLAKYQDDVIKGELITRRLMSGRRSYQLYFRHPYTSTGSTKEIKAAFERFLRERGYKVAPFTIGNGDFMFNKLYAEARSHNDVETTSRVRQAYLAYNDEEFEFFEGQSREIFGREIAQVLLIHANEINADCLDEMLSKLEARGYRFVTLDKALQDPAYRNRDDYIGPNGPSWLHRWTVALGMKMKLVEEPDPPKWVLDRFTKAQAQAR